MAEILVGVDSSAVAQRALQRAAIEAESAGSALHVVHAWTTPVWLGGIAGLGYNVLASPAESRQWATTVLDKQLADARENHPSIIPTNSETIEGDAKHVLVEHSSGASLLVLGGHGDGKVKGLLLGSATSYVLHHAQCPVMVVPDVGSDTTTLQRVIVGVDGSPASRSALRWGLAAARRHSCPLIALHAWLLTSAPGGPPLRHLAPEEEYQAQAQAWLDEEIAQTVPDTLGVEVRAELVRSTASWALLDKAGPDDLLVVGARGKGGFAELLLGSVADQCAQHARGLFVVVRADEERLGS